MLEPHHDKEFEKISNLILRQMATCYSYSHNLYTHIINYIHNTTGQATRDIIENIILQKGEYAKCILDKGGNDYYKFVLAFNQLWRKVGNKYMNFFNDHFFLDDNHLLSEGIKYITNDSIRTLLLSKDFLDLNEQLTILPQYTDSEAIISDFNMRFTLICAMFENALSYKDNKAFLYYFRRFEIDFNNFVHEYISNIESSDERKEP